jgi:hypothetical protein
VISKLRTPLNVPHFHLVDHDRIEAVFVHGNRHRAKLCIPFQGKEPYRSLCIIGQNPSDANTEVADKTVRYIEELIYKNYPEFSQLVVLNLFSRVDKDKSAVADLLDEECARVFEKTILEHEDILMIYGQLKVEGAYRFPERVRKIKHLFNKKKVWKLDIGKPYAPHPRNPAINYQKFDISLGGYDFSDITD